MKTQTISFTPELLAQLEASYNDAVNRGLEEFTWNGHPFVTGYAKYLIEHLHGQFNR